MRRIRIFCSRCMWFFLYTIPVVLGMAYVAGIQVKKYAIKTLNEKLDVRVDIQSVHISGIFTLPNVGIELVNIRVNESTDRFPGDLARLGSVRVEFNLLEIIRGHKEISQVSIHNGKVQIYEDSLGNNNYSIFKETDDSEDQDISIKLKKIGIENCQIVYRNDDRELYVSLRAHKMTASGALDQVRTEVAFNGSGFIDRLASAGQNVIAGKNFDLDIEFAARNDVKSYQIKKAVIGVERLYVDVTGDILMMDDSPNLDLKVEGRNVDIASLLSVLPYEQAKKAGSWKSAGNLKLNGYVKGLLSNENFPEIHLDFGISNGSMNNAASNLTISQLSMEGRLRNSIHQKRDLSLDLQISRLKMPHSNLNGKLKMKGFAAPGLDLDVHGELGLEDIRGFITSGDIKKLAGRADVDITGKIPWDVRNNDYDYPRIAVSGNIDCRDVQILLPDLDIHGLNLKGHIDGNNITDCKLSSKLDDNDVRFEGNVANWVGYAFSDKRLVLEGSLASQKLDLDAILSKSAGNDQTPDTDISATEAVSLDLGVDARLDVAVAYFKWLDFKADELAGRIAFESDRIWSDQLRIQCFNGRLEALGEVKAVNDGFRLDVHCLADKLDIKQIFTQFNDFGQTELTREHISGLVSADFDIRFNTDMAFMPKLETVYVLTDIHITKGRLKGYKPLESLSAFVEVHELRDIFFSDLENMIEIKDQTIYIPHMDVRSNAMNLTISGTHGFDNYMDYQIKIGLTELLASRSGWIRKKKEKKLEEGDDGGLAAYVLMTGTPDDLTLVYDKEAVKLKVKEEARIERKLFYSDLKKDIRGERLSTSKDKKVQWDE